MKNPYPLILTIFLAACGRAIPTASATITPSPYTTRTTTVPVTQTLSAIPATPDIDATATRFQLRVDGVCPTQTPSGTEPFSTPLSHIDTFAEFTGVYRYGTGHSVHELVIDCDRTYHERVWLDFGAWNFENGTASVQEGNMFVLDGIDRFGRMQQRMYIAIRWGPRHYLVDYSNGGKGFCEAWAQQSRSLEGGVSFFYLRVGDEALEAADDPVNTAGQKICP